MEKIFSAFLVFSLMSSCMTSSLVIDVQRPADINVSSDIQNIVIINRSRPSRDNLAGNIVEGLVSGEGLGDDRKGAEYCIEGLSNLLLNSDRYTLKNPGGMELKGTGTGSFPAPLSWNEIVSICGSYDGHAILALEVFDSDATSSVGDAVTSIKKVKGVKVKQIRYPAVLTMDIESGWRIYDVQTKEIVDENRFEEVKRFKAYGSSPDDAIRNLPSKRHAIKNSGLFAGRQYGFRISPVWVKVRRTYFTGRSKDFKLAKSHVKNGEWEYAIEIWKNLVNHYDPKIARRSSYNMAVASEIKGSIDTAIEWAHQAHKLGEKKASRYLNVLHIRKTNEEKLKQQLNN